MSLHVVPDIADVSAPLPPDARAVVVADGAGCDAAALRRLLERGTALRFVATVAPAQPGE